MSATDTSRAVQHAHACYADRCSHATVEIEENVQLARDTYRVRFRLPQMAAPIVPGQFLMMRVSGLNDPLLARPFALYDTVLDAAGRATGVDVVYLAVGKFTRRLSDMSAGERLDVWGPLGNGFPPTPAEHLIMVAGGIGQTPFLALGREFLGLRRYGDPARDVHPSPRVTLCYGTRSKEYLAGVEDFAALGLDMRLSTDDGSAGHQGLVTEQLAHVLDEAGPAAPRTCRVVCCGPEKMMEAVARLTADRGVPCEVSLETPMACGIGICFSCVTRVRDSSGGWDYRRTCVEGPVFNAAEIVF